MSAGWDLCTDEETKSSLIWMGLPAESPGAEAVLARAPGLHLRPTQVLALVGDLNQYWLPPRSWWEVQGLTGDGGRAKPPQEASLWDLLSCSGWWSCERQVVQQGLLMGWRGNPGPSLKAATVRACDMVQCPSPAASHDPHLPVHGRDFFS